MKTGKYELVIKWPSGQGTLCGEITDEQYGEICRILSPDHRAELSALKGRQGVTREDAEQFLAAYHAEVWVAAEDEDSRVAYDDAGRELAKAFLARFGDGWPEPATAAAFISLYREAFGCEPTIGEFRAYQLGEKARPAQTEQQPALTVWEGAMPESNGKSNYTAVLVRKGEAGIDQISNGMTIMRSEYPDRVRYEADCVRWLIGELKGEKPCVIDYDTDKHSGYAAPVAQPAPDDGVRVPRELIGRILGGGLDGVFVGNRPSPREELVALLAKGV